MGWLVEARARSAKATEGPWYWHTYMWGEERYLLHNKPPVPDARCKSGQRVDTEAVMCDEAGLDEADAEFIAHARMDLSRALDLIEELRVAAQRMLALPAAFDHAITEEEWLGMARALLSRIEGET